MFIKSLFRYRFCTGCFGYLHAIDSRLYDNEFREACRVAIPRSENLRRRAARVRY
jgi:hypothetical protein